MTREETVAEFERSANALRERADYHARAAIDHAAVGEYEAAVADAAVSRHKFDLAEAWQNAADMAARSDAYTGNLRARIADLEAQLAKALTGEDAELGRLVLEGTTALHRKRGGAWLATNIDCGEPMGSVLLVSQFACDGDTPRAALRAAKAALAAQAEPEKPLPDTIDGCLAELREAGWGTTVAPYPRWIATNTLDVWGRVDRCCFGTFDEPLNLQTAQEAVSWARKATPK